MTSQKTSESTSYSGSGQAWARPFAKAAAGTSFGVYDQAAPNLRKMSQNAFTLSDELRGRFNEGAAAAGVGRQHLMNTISGGPQGNPFLDQILGRTRENVIGDVNSQFSSAGRYGSGAHTGVLTDRLADAENQARFQDFNQQQGRMDMAANSLAGANQGEAAQAIGALPVAAGLPYTGTGALASQLAALFSGGQSNSVSYGPNPLWGALGAGLGAAGMAASGGAFGSDRRLKKDIVELHKRSDGLTVYEWTYRNDPDQRRYQGFMADEVKEIYPAAYIEDFNGTGYQGVNYAEIPHETKLAA